MYQNFEATVYQWDVHQRKKTFQFDCDMCYHATGLVVAQTVTERLFDEITDSPPLSPTVSKKPVIPSEEGENIPNENKAPLLASPGSSGHVKNQSPSDNALNLTPLLTKVARKAQPSLMFSHKPRKAKQRAKTRHSDQCVSGQMRPRSGALTDKTMRLGTVLLVGDTLWVGRSIGDVLVINVRKPTSNSVVSSFSYNSANRAKEPFIFGQVLAQMSDDLMRTSNLLKEVSLLKKVGQDHVAAVFRIETKGDSVSQRLHRASSIASRQGSLDECFDQFRLLMFEAWSCHDFEAFSTEIHAMHLLEEKA